MNFHMLSQITCLTGGIFASVAFFTFRHCDITHALSYHLAERRHICIDCICMTCLQCVFSNVSPKHLPERMHINNGCICLTFLQYVSSNGFSNYPKSK